MSEIINAMYVKIDDIIPNKSQPRKYFNENSLNELAQSIKSHGIINPITVRKLADKYEIIAGERRYRAAKMAGLEKVPVIVTTISEEEMSEIALIENLQRQEFTSIEEATSYDKLLTTSNNNENNLSEKLGKSPNSISNKIKLLSLPEEIKDALANEKISERHAKSLSKLDDKEEQLELLDKIMREKLTVKETEQIISKKEITDEEVQNAINDIMKSLNLATSTNEVPSDETSEESEESKNDIENHMQATLSEEDINENQKEEKKEDEKMNNGNFFPNYDNNMASNPMGMNMMPDQNNMMNQPMPMEQEMVMPTPVMNQQTAYLDPMSGINIAPPQAPIDNNMMNQPMPEQSPMMENQMVPTFDYNSTQNMDNANQIPLTPIMNEPTMMDQPLFNQDIQMSQEPMMNQPMPVEMNNINIQEPQQLEVPAFNPIPEPTPMIEQVQQNDQFIPSPVSEPMYVPEMSMEQPMVNSINDDDKFSQVENILNQNGIPYKAYSNETGHCIIIEV